MVLQVQITKNTSDEISKVINFLTVPDRYSSQGHDVRSVAARPRKQDERDCRAHEADGVEYPAHINQTQGAPGVERVCNLTMDEASGIPVSREVIIF